jgi:uncharacterized protein (DUF1684 family)
VSNKIISLLISSLLAFIPLTALAQSAPSHEDQINEWRQSRNERLADDSGWMTLVGLEWLQEGENTVGSDPASTAKIPGGPDNWGTLFLAGEELRFVPAAGSGVTVNEAMVADAMLVADNQDTPSVVRSGDLSFYVIFRESYGLRIKDRKAPALLNFSSVPVYTIQQDWKFNARFIPATDGQTIEIANVLGHLSPTPVYGYAEFERDGQTYRLLGLGDEDSESMWFLFADRTSGKETYGAGRFLYSDGLPENGRVVVDFNKAYNPPCAFNDYSTCPLPPHENRLDLAVTAGEKDYHSH